MKTLVINNNTFIWRNNQKGIMYNSSNFKSFIFNNTGLVKSVCNQMDKLETLYSININESHEIDNDFQDWINKSLDIDAARIIHVNQEEYKEISFKPILKIHKDITTIKLNKSYHNMVECLNEITIHLSGFCIEKEKQLYHKQFLYTVDMEETLDYENLAIFLSHIPFNNKLKFNLIGDIFNYYKIDDLLSLLALKSSTINIFYTEESFTPDKVTNRISNHLVNFYIICSAKNHISLRKNIPKNKLHFCKFILLIEDYYDIKYYEGIQSFEDIVDVRPIFSTSMIEFFKERIYLNKFDLDHIKLTKSEIFANQVINTNFFGKIEILPNGTICDNVNFDQIGHINNDFWYIMKEIFTEDRAWFYSRKQIPCSHCIYQWLCPPPSNYELVIGKSNLCTLDQPI